MDGSDWPGVHEHDITRDYGSGTQHHTTMWVSGVFLGGNPRGCIMWEDTMDEVVPLGWIEVSISV